MRLLMFPFGDATANDYGKIDPDFRLADPPTSCRHHQMSL
jgi:hypothetical protein